MQSDIKKKFITDTCSKKIIFFTGKGGVGKSTVAWSVAKLCAKRGKKVFFLSLNEFDEETKLFIKEERQITFIALNAKNCFKEYAIKKIKFEKIYNTLFDNPILQAFIQAAPGLSDTVISGKILDLKQTEKDALIIVDLPASGHAFSFFQSVFGVEKLFGRGFVYNEAKRIIDMFTSNESRIDFVAIPEELSIKETEELQEKLLRLGPFQLGFLYLNLCLPDFPLTGTDTIQKLSTPTQKAIAQYQTRFKNEKNAKSDFSNFQTPCIEIPRFPVKESKDAMEKILNFMES